MGVKDVLVNLWVLSAAVQIRHASTGLSVSPNVTATCGQSVTLHCNVSSNQGLVYHLSWIKDNITLCKVKDDHLVDDEQPTSDVECRYANKSMFVTFRQTSKEQQERALDEYICKLRSYQGPAIKKTWVELKGQRPVECIQRVDQIRTAEVPTCSFTGVRHDGDVHWYREDARLTEDDAVIEKKESVDKECCLTIISSLKPKKDSTGPYTCSLWNSQSQNYTANHTFPHIPSSEQSTSGSGMLQGRWSIGNCLIISVLLTSL
ncbi:uncharacterized protein LOC115541006 isoform X1 [Gadus morhua]|uniref:uncharacterized protein LOC115541006 isoform X1 n=1 Tax=Gadus morhua TaxID=8049 RepID=UPI0011B68999|nr:uncharacterized protein LOC115541006 isoform X1 [Gadus morhua]XP_030208580.1 uncharacterized protein LOC115541006 isoform X1 [Gadus morhua]XP_030208581.1 uncharacterized protein LOC115541006 isoform X1 [Gadus morhua]